MKLFTGPIMQLAHVVMDVDAAIAHWQSLLGVGPFDIADEVPYEWVAYRGHPIELVNRVAIAYSGDLQIELIQQLSRAPSIFSDYAGGSPHHLGVLSDDFAGERDRLVARGVDIIQEGRTVAGVDFAYFDLTAHETGAVVELVKATPGLRRYFGKLKARAATWAEHESVV